VMPLRSDGNEFEVFGEPLRLRSRAAGKLDRDPDGRRVYRPYGNKNRVADSNDRALLLDADGRALAEKLRSEQCKGDKPFCHARKRPLMIIHPMEIATFAPDDTPIPGKTEVAYSLSFMLPPTRVAAVTREYQVNAVYRRQLELGFVDEEDDDEEQLENV